MRPWLRRVLVTLAVLLVVAGFLAFSALISSRGAGLGDGAPFPP